jgi:basic amino acid/polyamine antiporter, APA family
MKENKISLFTAIMTNVNIMVGAGIFINPQLMAQKAGGLSFLGWAASALVFLPIVLSISKISQLFPEEGSFFNYSRKTLGKTVGFLSGWIYFLGYVAVGSTQMLALRDLLIYKLGFIRINNYLILFNAVFFATFCLLSLLSLKAVSKIQSVVTIFKLLPIIILVFFLIFTFWGNPFSNLMVTQNNIESLKATLPLAIFGYWGFEACCSMSHLIKGSKKNASRAIIIGFFLVVSIYTIFHFGLIKIMGANNLSLFGTSNFVNFLGIRSNLIFNMLSSLVTSAILAAYASAIYGALNTQSFLLCSMAKEKLMFCSKTISKINKINRPVYAILTLGFFEFLFVTLINHKIILISISNLGMLGAFFLTLISLSKIQIQKKKFKSLVTPVLAFISCGILIFYSWQEIGNLIYILPFLLSIIIGFIIFKIQQKRRKPVL